MGVAGRILLGAALVAEGCLFPGPWQLLPVPSGSLEARAGEPACQPTAPDSAGPFYKPGAPERASIGKGLVVSVAVRIAGSCAPIPRARIEWWQANPRGQYDDAHRASQTADAEGRYRFETNFPAVYPGRPPHIHVKIVAPGHRPLTTQLYPRPGQTELPFDFVLRPL